MIDTDASETVLGAVLSKIIVRNYEPERPLDTDHDSLFESQQDSDVPPGRESRLRRRPVRFGIDEFIKNIK